MNEEKNQNQIDHEVIVSDYSKKENKIRRNWWIEIVSLLLGIFARILPTG